MRIAALQMTSGPDVSSNLELAHGLIRQAVDRHADLIALPEYFAFRGGGVEPKLGTVTRSGTVGGLIPETLQEWAVEYGVWIVGGSIPLPTTGKKFTNTCLVYSPEGKKSARYDKIHLFNSYGIRESNHFKAGTEAVRFRVDGITMGLSICYDLRFPSHYRGLAQAGAQVLFIPSAFTAKTGQAHWDVLTRARAIENVAYVIAPAQASTPEHLELPEKLRPTPTWGHSRIIDPWGRVIAERPHGAGIVWADLDFNRVQQLRKELPVLKNEAKPKF